MAEENRPAPVEGPQKSGAEYVAPIIVNTQRLGTLRMVPARDGQLPMDDATLAVLAEKNRH